MGRLSCRWGRRDCPIVALRIGSQVDLTLVHMEWHVSIERSHLFAHFSCSKTWNGAFKSVSPISGSMVRSGKCDPELFSCLPPPGCPPPLLFLGRNDGPSFSSHTTGK